MTRLYESGGRLCGSTMAKRSAPGKKWRRRVPAASAARRRAALSAARRVAEEYRAKGASAVVLAGSWARGDAQPDSDIDLWVLGVRGTHDALWRDGFLVNVDLAGERAQRSWLRRPPRLGATVPAWRHARILFDRYGRAARLRDEARAFRWSRVARRCDRWVAETIVGWAEEVTKLVRALATGNDALAATQRNLLADQLAFVMAIHRRRFWESEYEFWREIAREVGGSWARAQRSAFGLGSSRTLEASCRGALRLYGETARAGAATLSEEERTIVDATLRAAGLPALTRR
jgi:predicted nucleotidyltransferase